MLLVAALLLGTSGPDLPARADPALVGTACPPSWSGLPLRGGTVYDGPPEDNAILKPYDGDELNDGISTWRELAFIYDAGRQVWLGCSYVEDALLYVRVDRKVARCRFVERRSRVALSCR